MARRIEVNYVKGIVICHGKSELQLVKYATTNLHLNIHPYARANGKTSIQITSLMDVLNSRSFRNINSFLEQYSVETEGKGKKTKLVNFKLYTVMDTDDCTQQQKEEYITKKMFANHWASDYIVPIFNNPKLEYVMQKCGLLTKKISSGEKNEYYTRIFPINGEPLSFDTKKEIKYSIIFLR